MSAKRESADLLICARCHKYPALVLDTIDSIRTFTDPRVTQVMAAVDGDNRKLAQLLEKALPGAVYLAGRSHNWGPGLYGLLAESIVWARKRWSFSHLLSVDYDTLFIGEGVDELLLGQLTAPRIGLVGEYNPKNVHWREVFQQERKTIEERLGRVPKSYNPGEGVQGGCMLLSCAFLERMQKLGMLASPFAVPEAFTKVADDHLIPLYCRMCGLDIEQVPLEVHVRWHLDCNPKGLEKKGVKVFHPTKIRPDRNDPKIEIEVRNYFRALRKRPPLKTYK